MQGLSYHYKIHNWARAHNDHITEAEITAELGYSICENGDNDTGVKMCYSALKIAEQTGNKQAIGIVYDNLSVCLGDNNPALGKTYGEKALKFAQAAKDTLTTAWALANLSASYYRLHERATAKNYAALYLEWSVSNYKDQAASALATWSRFVPDYEKLKYYRYTVVIATNRRDDANKAEALLDISSYYLRNDKRDSALYYARKVYQLTAGSSLREKLYPALLLSKSFSGKADSTLKYALEYYAIRDSLQNFNKAQRAQALAFADEHNRR